LTFTNHDRRANLAEIVPGAHAEPAVEAESACRISKISNLDYREVIADGFMVTKWLVSDICVLGY
jgi:hypothetical protein